MDIVYNILIGYIIFAVIVIYSLSFGNSNFHRDGIVGKINRFLTTGLPNFCSSILSFICPRFLKRYSERFIDYFLYKPNRILQIAYLILVVGGSYLFMKDTYPYLNGYIAPTYHKIGSVIAIVITLTSFVVSSVSDPGYITHENHSGFQSKFKYDRILYVKKSCETCEFVKPSRSKHCRVCDKCVARFDHHCPWINNCVGEKNLRYFLIFVGNTSALCFYGFYLCTCALFTIIDDRNLLKLGYNQNGKWTPLPTSLIIRYLFAESKTVFPLGIFCLVISLFLCYFWCYHLFLVATNRTTNETFKWDDIKDQIRLNRINEKKRLAKKASKKNAKKVGGENSSNNEENNNVNLDDHHFDDDDELFENDFISNDTDKQKELEKEQQRLSSSKANNKRKSKKKNHSHHDDNDERVTIPLPLTIKELKNPFDQSLMSNFKEVFFP
ncbi:hypothetical protein PPL_12294 [Heterostelium album PN500]|uniref:Palmitoyltransferase n=1 Tax=Heterostelium pallidum (strain ATCC 26659 / Pp 5 / PN500) TaxID=670386 RepID=D3BM84_HETP5|nr:hypothetical protein PPL_12294 [Heterostelium album PN500]EFA77685.1 hypothetical protein PPL_12294 [Heterostelium album PN500]|eukprot:XP_020429813.1 hypothetical protein PPL_12294 [Heterostelium album PN500]